MSEDAYFVVFEKDNVRKYFEFDNQNSFDRQYKEDWGTVIEKGVSKEKALLLCGADQKVIDCLDLSPWIYVVFEYTAEAGGYFKNRYYMGFRHPFEIKHLLLNKVVIVAEVYTQEAAINFIKIVPPICLYMAAIEDAFTNEPEWIAENLRINLANAHLAAESTDRELWTRGKSAKSVDSQLKRHLQALAHPSNETAKSAVIANLLLLYNFDDNRIYSFIRESAFINQMVDNCTFALKIQSILK